MEQTDILLLLFLWGNVEFTLTKEVCPQQLPTVEHAFALDEYKKVKYLKGDVIYFSCDPGYTTGLNATYVCTEDGWTAVTIGHCVKDDGSFSLRLGCAPPPALENGYILRNTMYFYEDGQKAQFQCDPSYKMKGGPSKTCTNGQWTGDLQCQDVHAVLRDVTAQLDELQTKMKELQTLNQGQAAELRSLKTWSIQTGNHLNSLMGDTADQASKMKELQTNDLDPMKEQLRGQAAELRSLKAWTREAGNHLDSLLGDRAKGRVAFSASLLASGKGVTGPFNTTKTLVYKYVIFNFGNAYNPDTGKFTAPVTGAYHFSFHVSTGLGSPGVNVSLMKNVLQVCAAAEIPSENKFGTTGNEITVLLEAGDVVFVQLWKDYRVFDSTGHVSTFSGRLLFPV